MIQHGSASGGGRRSDAGTVLMAAVVYLIADLLLLIPAFFLAIGVQAIGRSAGWWLGDSNSNDGEEFLGTSIGVLAMLIVLPAAGRDCAAACQCRRRSAGPCASG